jgi:uncharacterized membrane protein YdbT with pleckstrin-like domain
MLGFIDKNLIPGEVIRYRGRPRAFHLFERSMAILFISLIVWWISKSLSVFVLFFALTLIAVVWDYFNLRGIEIAVTNKRVVIKTGYFKKVFVEIFTDKIEGIRVEQGILHRILNSGDIIIDGVGGTKENIRNVENPGEFRRQVQSHVEEFRKEIVSPHTTNK